MGTPTITNPTRCFEPILFALNNDPNSEKPMIDFLVANGLQYQGKQNKDNWGFSRENVFVHDSSNFKLVISWMRNLATIKYSPSGWEGAFTEVIFDNIRKCSVGYVGHNSLAFCWGEYEMMKLAIPNGD